MRLVCVYGQGKLTISFGCINTHLCIQPKQELTSLSLHVILCFSLVADPVQSRHQRSQWTREHAAALCLLLGPGPSGWGWRAPWRRYWIDRPVLVLNSSMVTRAAALCSFPGPCDQRSAGEHLQQVRRNSPGQSQTSPPWPAQRYSRLPWQLYILPSSNASAFWARRWFYYSSTTRNGWENGTELD